MLIEVLSHDQLVVRIDSSQRLMRKNRKYLRLYNSVSTNIKNVLMVGRKIYPAHLRAIYAINKVVNIKKYIKIDRADLSEHIPAISCNRK